MSASSYKLEIPSKTENIALVENFIENICQELSIGEELYGNILVSVTEAVNNGIIHGNNLDETKTVELTIRENKDVIIFCILDKGNGFNYNDLPDPTLPENLQKPS